MRKLISLLLVAGTSASSASFSFGGFSGFEGLRHFYRLLNGNTVIDEIEGDIENFIEVETEIFDEFDNFFLPELENARLLK